MELLDILLETLKQDERFVSQDWVLLKNTIREKAENLDDNLISLLLDNEVLREKFFLKIKDIIVFDNNKFIKFINNKAFLPDSYTSFKNKIGLTTEKGDFIASSNEVILNFPFKDCVLVGWQDKEDAKRDEIFYNEILGQDDIDRLFDKKVFTNFKRINKDWEHKLDWFNRDENGIIKDNLIIKWNNLLALHSLKSNFAWKVKLIYIDPPYNTWNDSFNYNDKFNHSTWLTFMKNRLEVAKELLRDDWVIFVQCDYRENAYLRVLMDEIFWMWNFVNEICWKKYGWVKNQASKRLTTQQETILLYSKTDNFIPYPVYNKLSEKYVNDEYKYIDENWRRYAKLRWRWYQDWNSTTKIKYLDENPGSPITTLWAEDFLQLNTSSNEKVGDFVWQKPEALIKRIIELSTKENDIVLDYHLWSWTTCVVAHKMWRQYIWIEQMDYIETLSMKRLINVLKWDNSWISKDVEWSWWWEFVYMEIMQENESFINKIKNAKNIKDLLEIYNQIKYREFINYKVDIWNLEIDNLEEKDFQDFKLFLIEILDKNSLYNNYSEMNDISNEISTECKNININFYLI